MLVRAKTAAEKLGLKLITFYKRNYTPTEIIDGVAFYDVDKLERTRKKRSDAGKPKKAKP